MKVILYSKRHCPLCDEAEEILQDLKQEFSLDIEEVDIYQNDALLEEYQLKIPVVVANGRELDYGKVSRERVERQLRTFID